MVNVFNLTALKLAEKNLLGFGYVIEVFCFISSGICSMISFPLSFSFLINGGIWSYVVGKGIEIKTLINYKEVKKSYEY